MSRKSLVVSSLLIVSFVASIAFCDEKGSCEQFSSTGSLTTQVCGDKTTINFLDLPVAGKSQKKENESKMPIEWSDFFSGLPEGGTYVIRDTESWKNLWVRVRDGEAPQVDFSKQMVLAAFLGMKPTGGYAIRISRIEKSKKEWRVFIQESRPPKGAFVIQAFTSPYHIKVVERTDLPVGFKKTK